MSFLTRRKYLNGSWGNYYIVYFEDGKRKVKSTKTKRKGEADKIRLRYLESLKDRVDNKILFTDFKRDYLDFLEPNHMHKTVLSYRCAFNEFIRILGDKNMDSYSLKEIDSFLLTKTKECQSNYTAKKYKNHLRVAFEQAKKWGYIKTNLFNECMKVKVDQNEVKFMSIEEFKKLMNVVDNELYSNIFVFAVSTGMRLGEIIHLKKDDLDLNNKTILVRSDNEHRTKSKKSRTIEIAQILFPLISKYMESNSQYVFEKNGKILSPSGIAHKFKYYLRKAKLDDNYNFHTLRKTYGSWLLQKGVPIEKISKFLGHCNILVTQMHYASLIKDKFDGEVNAISELLQPDSLSKPKEKIIL